VRTILTTAVMMLVLLAAGFAQDKVYKPGQDGVTAPVLTKDVKPTYTKGAMDRRVEGTVEVAAIVRTDGTVDNNVRVTRSLDPELDEQGIKAVRQWEFKPGTKDGHPVAVEVNIELTFTLKE
jgi:periplasmic protein TonB